MRRSQKSVERRKCVAESLEARRLFSAGALDTTFNTSGKDSIIFSGLTVTGHATAVQSDGKIVEVGGASNGDYAIVRYDANGVEDSTFGAGKNGQVTAIIKHQSQPIDVAQSVAIQADGKILVAGTEEGIYSDGFSFMFVARYTAAGVLDKTFGTGGTMELDHFDSSTAYTDGAYGLAVQNDGKIIVAGYESQGLFTVNDNVVLARLNTNGSLDTTFGPFGGKINLDLGQQEVGEAVAIDYTGTASTNSDYGKIIVVGHELQTDEEQNFNYYNNAKKTDVFETLIARYNTNGTLDKTFNGSGSYVGYAGTTIKSLDAHAVTIEAGGKIVIAGSAGTNFGSTDHNFFLARFNVNGSVDKTFGTAGSTFTDVGGDDYATSIVVGGFGEQLIVGGTSSGKIALTAYNLNGNLDTAFATGGIVTTKTQYTASNVQLALSPNHTIVAGGGIGFNTARYFDIGPIVSVASTDATAGPSATQKVGKITEIIPNYANFIVSRDENLTVATTVNFTVSGTAKPPTAVNIKEGKNNYTLGGVTITTVGSTTTYSVVIAAGTTSTTVTLTPVNIPAATQTAIFTIVPSVNFFTATASSQTITILGTNPAPVVLADIADDTVRAGTSYATKNYGTQKTLSVSNGGSSTDYRQAYMMFDLSSLSTVNKVTLSLYGALTTSADDNLQTAVYGAGNATWTETGLTNANKPGVAPTVLATATILNTTQKTYTYDLTAYVKAQLAAGTKTLTLVLYSTTTSTGSFTFNSKEAGSNVPTLTVS